MSGHIVDRYCEAVNSGEPEAIVALFASDGTLRNPMGTFVGTEEILGFYREVVVAGRAEVDKGAVLVDGSLVMAEIVAGSPLDPAARVHALDVFRLDDSGAIDVLEIYYR